MIFLTNIFNRRVDLYYQIDIIIKNNKKKSIIQDFVDFFYHVIIK